MLIVATFDIWPLSNHLSDLLLTLIWRFFFNCFSKPTDARVLCKFFCQIIMGSPLNSNVPEGISLFRSRSGSREFFRGHFICIVKISSFCTFSFPESLKSLWEILLSTKNLLLWTKDQPIIEILNIRFFHHPNLPFAKLHFLRLLLSVLDSNKQCSL